jgi:hypothetical protein
VHWLVIALSALFEVLNMLEYDATPALISMMT